MKIRIEGGLPFVSVSLLYGGRQTTLEQVLLDTGSAACVFSADEVAVLGVLPDPADPLRRIRGVGGSEFVYGKTMDALILGEMRVEGLSVQIGALDYGFQLQGILGMDFFLRVGAFIDLDRLTVGAGRR